MGESADPEWIHQRFPPVSYLEFVPLVYIIIVNFNGMKWLHACITSVLDTTYENFEVIVVDNGSVDGSADYVKSFFSQVHVIINDKNLGFCEGNNIGLQAAIEKNADYCVLLNNDTTVTKTWLSELISVGEADETVGILGAVQLSYGGEEFNSWTNSVAKEHLNELREPATARKWIRMRWVEGSCFAIKREVIERVGMLDPIYFMYFEEIDYCRRAQAHGYEVALVPRSRFHHFRGGTANASPELKRLRAHQYDRSHFIYHLSDLRKLFVVNILRYFLTLSVKCFEHVKQRRLSRIWDLVKLQPEILRSIVLVRDKLLADRRTMREQLHNRK